MTWGQILKRRSKLLFIFLASNALYDYLYLLGLLALVVAIPLNQCNEKFECGKDTLEETVSEPIIEVRGFLAFH
jgi:hypothetical protein